MKEIGWSSDLALKGRYDFLDGLVMAHACDSVQRMYGIWTSYRPLAFTHLLNVPHTVTPWSERFFYRELQFFAERVARFAGVPMEADRLRATVALYNRTRDLIRDLYELRKTEPPALSGTELLQVLVAGTGVPAAEFHALLTEVKAEVVGRGPRPSGRRARLLFYGCINDDVTLVRLIEECGADVVMDDTCIGARGLLGRVTDDGDLWAGPARPLPGRGDVPEPASSPARGPGRRGRVRGRAAVTSRPARGSSRPPSGGAWTCPSGLASRAAWGSPETSIPSPTP